MKNDAIFYIALHLPFALVLGWMMYIVRQKNFTLFGIAVYVVVHTITILAYIQKWGDDFAITTYWSMYLVLPAILCYYRLYRVPKDDRKYFIYLPIAILVIPMMGIGGIIGALMFAPMDWR